MNLEAFLAHHGLKENPFVAEEARHDPVFDRLEPSQANHPDFPKILGSIDRPSTAVVFGEKGSGKTAIRLLIGRKVDQHNRANEEIRTLLVAYDDLNPFLDRLMARHRRTARGPVTDQGVDKALKGIRLEDHQDAILSLAVTKLVDALLDRKMQIKINETPPLPKDADKRMRAMPRQYRADLAILAAVYDQPRRGAAMQRWMQLRSLMRLGRLRPTKAIAAGAIAVALLTLGIIGAYFFYPDYSVPLLIGGCATGAAALLLGTWWLWRRYTTWRLTRSVRRETQIIDRTQSDLLRMLLSLRREDLVACPWPLSGNKDARYQLTNRLMGVLEALGYGGMIVLVDRVDEPTLVAGRAQRMVPIIWPLLDNKFLQQANVGLKLLLPMELRHALHRESPEFFQEARLDKQNLVDRLSWSGATLYDLCSARLRACRRGEDAPAEDAPPQAETEPGDDQATPLREAATGPVTGRSSGGMALTDLFEPDVTAEMLVDALDQMHQPRDAFKFLYSVIQEHCRQVPDDRKVFAIPRLVLETVRRQQSQRVQDLYRGVSPS